MKSEIYFEKKKLPKIIAFIVLSILELLIFSKFAEYYNNSNFVSLIIQQSVIVLIFLPIFWKLQINDALKFYEDGISYITIIERKFLRWSNIDNVKLFEHSHGDLLLITAKNQSVRIYLSIFKNKDEVIKFLNTKLKN